MPNKQYVKGRRKEYKLCKELREEGYDIVQRTAGSHSSIDIIAINKRDKQILFIQSKPNELSEHEIRKLMLEQFDLNDLYYYVRFEVR